MTASLIHCTAHQPGAIAILQLSGNGESMLQELTGIESWPIGRMRLASFREIDIGLAVRLNERVAQLMPHGGPRVVQRLTEVLLDLGAVIPVAPANSSIDPCDIYPEAQDRIEAIMLQTLARAASPLAIDLLLDQTRRWRAFHTAMQSLTDEDRQRSERLNRLIDPPIVVLAGRPNVGKSTLSNGLLGRNMSIALDMPGTTRDYTMGRIDLNGLVVDWHDTPGIRDTSDPIERKAIELSHRLIERADLLIAMRDPNTDWPELPRSPDVHVINKCDLLEKPRLTTEGRKTGVQPTLSISATTGLGISELVSTVRETLVSKTDLDHPDPWLFDVRLTG